MIAKTAILGLVGVLFYQWLLNNLLIGETYTNKRNIITGTYLFVIVVVWIFWIVRSVVKIYYI